MRDTVYTFTFLHSARTVFFFIHTRNFVLQIFSSFSIFLVQCLIFRGSILLGILINPCSPKANFNVVRQNAYE